MVLPIGLPPLPQLRTVRPLLTMSLNLPVHTTLMVLISSTFAAIYFRFSRLITIHISWEYPGGGGMPCNTVNPNDTANFLEFITELRQLLPDLILSAAVSVNLFRDTTGHPISDASGFAKQLNWIEVMNYDVFGPSFSTVTGPNAPLDDSCSPYPEGSAMSAVKAWTKAGFSANQIVLGVPSYGHSFSVPRSTAVSSSNQLQIYTSFDKDNTPQGDAWDYVPPGSVDQCGQPEGPNGIFNFWALVGYGYLNSDGSVASGMLSTFDQCSQTVSTIRFVALKVFQLFSSFLAIPL